MSRTAEYLRVSNGKRFSVTKSPKNFMFNHEKTSFTEKNIFSM